MCGATLVTVGSRSKQCRVSTEVRKERPHTLSQRVVSHVCKPKECFALQPVLQSVFELLFCCGLFCLWCRNKALYLGTLAGVPPLLDTNSLDASRTIDDIHGDRIGYFAREHATAINVSRALVSHIWLLVAAFVLSSVGVFQQLLELLLMLIRGFWF